MPFFGAEPRSEAMAAPPVLQPVRDEFWCNNQFEMSFGTVTSLTFGTITSLSFGTANHFEFWYYNQIDLSFRTITCLRFSAFISLCGVLVL